MEKELDRKKFKDLVTKGEHLHGFQKPFSKHQVVTWVFYLFNIL
jgi:hypothetical protein